MSPRPYRPVADYYRQEHLEFYRRSPSPTYGVTFELDATALKSFAAERDLPLYPSLAYAFLRALQGIEDFRIRLVDDAIVLYDELLPALAVPAPGGRFSFCALETAPDLVSFHRAAARDLALAQSRVLLTGGAEPNYVLFTALPRVPFTSFTHVPPTDPTDGRPRVAFGKLSDDPNARRLPVALLVNHLYVDGAALGQLFDAAQAIFSAPAALGAESG